MYSYNNNHLPVVQSSPSPAADWDVKNKMFIGLFSVNKQHLSFSLSCSQNIENTELSLPVPLSFVP